MTSSLAPESRRRNHKVGAIAAAAALAMLGLGYASVPLYRLFCQATGFNGTTQRSTEAQAAGVKATMRPITVRFDANVAPNLPWDFRPEQVTQEGRIGERKIAFFIAKNRSSRAITGRAVFNVTPEQTGAYFHKIQCFCFSEQKLEAGQEVRMPVIYYVDPAILKDANAADTPEITLSYTFMEAAGTNSAEQAAKPLDRDDKAR